MLPASRHTSLNSFRLFAVALLTLVLIVNVMSFIRTENERLGARVKALSTQVTDDLLELSFHNKNMSTRYGMYFSLAEIAPESVVIIASEAQADRGRYAARLYQVSEVADVVISDIKAVELLQELDIAPHVVASGPGGFGGAPWLLAIADSPAGLGKPEAPDDFAREQMFAHPSERRPSGPPREFLMLHWPEPRSDGDPRYDYVIWFVDTGLLSASWEDPPT